MFRQFYGKPKEKKKTNKKKDKNAGREKGHQRMSTEEQINYALQVSLQEAEQNNTAAPGGFEANAAAASYRHQRMTTAEQINLAMQRSLEDQGAPASPDKTEEPPTAGSTDDVDGDDGGAFAAPPAKAAAAGGHARMNTEQAIEIAIANSLAEVRLPDGAPDTWTAEDLGDWIANLNEDYQKYGDEIKSRGITGKKFASYEKAKKLKSIGIRNSDHRDNIWVAFNNEMKTHDDRKDGAKQQEEEQKSTNKVASLFDTDKQSKKERKQKKQESFGGVGDLFGSEDEVPASGVSNLFGDEPAGSGVSSLFDSPPEKTENKPAQRKPKSKKAQSSFGGVSSLFGPENDEEEDAGEPKPAEPRRKDNPSFGGVYDIFGSNDDEMKVKDFNAGSSSGDAAQKLEDAQKTISRLEKKLEGERRKVEKLKKELNQERQEKQQIEIELTQMKQGKSSQQTKAPEAAKESENAPVEMGFISFSQEETKESHLHKRDPSYTGVSGLFDDLNFGSDEDEDPEEPIFNDPSSMTQTVAAPTKGKDKHKRDPSFNGVLDLFDDDEAAELGFGTPEVSSQIQAKKDRSKRDPSFSGVANLFADEEDEDDGGLGLLDGFDTEPTPVAGAPQKHKRDPSYSGVKDLFDDDEPEEAEEDYNNQRHNKNASFSGVRDLFAEEMAPVKMTNVQESQIDELKQKIQALESKLQGYESDYQDKEAQVESLAETLSMKEQQLQRVREREEELEQQNSAMRNEFNQKIQEMSESKGVDSLITQELQRSKVELEETTEKLRNVTKEAEQLSVEIQTKSQELDMQSKTLSKERQRNRDLQENLEKFRGLAQKAESELQIRRETSQSSDHQEALINTRQDNEELRREKAEMQKEVKSLQESIRGMHESKIRLVQNVALELDRMRGMFQEINVANEAKARSATVG